jgi:hypothetical protein
MQERRIGLNGTVKYRERKYEAPRGRPNRAYFPAGTIPAIANHATPLLITEGEKKAMAADQAGLPCIGLCGVYSWQKARPKEAVQAQNAARELIDDLAGIAWAGRPVCIIFDSDAATNGQVQWAEWHLAEALTARGAIVSIARIPAASDPDKKVGLDDWLVAHGNSPACIVAILANKTPPTRPPLSERTGTGTRPGRHEREYVAEFGRELLDATDTVTIVRHPERRRPPKPPRRSKCGPVGPASTADDIDQWLQHPDVIKFRTEQIESDAARAAIAEETARQLHAARRDDYPCMNTIGIFLACQMDSKILERRCEKWDCHGCRALLEREWIENVKLRLSVAAALGQPLYAATVSRSAWNSRVRRRLRRAGADHFFAYGRDSDTFYVVCNVEMDGDGDGGGDGGGFDPVSPGAAIENLSTLIRSRHFSGKRIFSSRPWRVPRVKIVTGKYKRLGIVQTPLIDSSLRHVAEGNRVRMSEGRHEYLLPWVVRSLKFKHPPNWTWEDVHHWYFQVCAGDVLPNLAKDDITEWLRRRAEAGEGVSAGAVAAIVKLSHSLELPNTG